MGSACMAVASHGEKSLFIEPVDFIFLKEDGASPNPDVVGKDVLHLTLDCLNLPRPEGAAGFR